MTKKRSAPLASSVGSPAASLTSFTGAVESTARPLSRIPASAAGVKLTCEPLSVKVPALRARLALFSTRSLPGSLPKELSPSFSQKRPASVSQPLSLVSELERFWRQASTLACSAAAPAPATAGTSHERDGERGAQAQRSGSGPWRHFTRWQSWRHFRPSRLAPEDLLAHVGDLACS